MFNPFSVFGWKFKETEKEETIAAPYIQPMNDDASFTVGSNYYAWNSYNLSFDQSFTSENDLIKKYRDIALYPEVDEAVSDIINEAISDDENSSPVSIILDDLDVSDKTKEIITEEFDKILKLLNFNMEAYDIFRKWYVDGRLNYHIIIDEKKPKAGIVELRYISPFNIKKVREEKKGWQDGIEVILSTETFYVYTPYGYINNAGGTNGIKLTNDSVCSVTSGLVDETSKLTYSFLHKAIKSVNQLRMIEDAVVIYRLARAPERRIFYIDIGSLPKNKAEDYLRNVSSKYKNKIVYDVSTGEVKDQTSVLSMMEDFWLPRSSNGRSTEVTTLQSGQNLGEINDIQYFLRKVYKSLNVPMSRMSSDQAAAFNIGRSSEITRDEIKFSKFIGRLRKRFSHLFYSLLKTQLLLKNIINENEWQTIKENISFDFLSDTFFSELKNAEILKERITTYNEALPLIGNVFSHEWAKKNILMLTDEEIKTMNDEIKKEINNKEEIPTVIDNGQNNETENN